MVTFIVVLIVLGAQRFLKLHSYTLRPEWAPHYVRWMSSRVKPLLGLPAVLGALILLLPIVLLAVALVLLLKSFSMVGLITLGLVLLWFFLDARDLKKEPYAQMDNQTVFLNSYDGLFSILFWYCILGPIGLLLYVSIVQIAVALSQRVASGAAAVVGPAAESSESQAAESEAKPPVEGEGVSEPSDMPAMASLSRVFSWLRGLFDWIPIRLLGLSFALVSNFSQVFKLWLPQLYRGVSISRDLIVEWGEAALKSVDDQVEPAANLIDRALLVWLVILLLVLVL